MESSGKHISHLNSSDDLAIERLLQTHRCELFINHLIQTIPKVYSTETDNLPRYTNSYDTTVARESWSLSNEQNLTHEMENMSTILMKL